MANDSDRPGWIDEHIPAELVDSALFRFKVVLMNENTIEVDMLKDIEVDYDLLEEQLRGTSAQYTWWAAVYSEVRRTVAFVERRIKARRGRLTETYLEKARAAGLRPTDKQVANIVDGDKTIDELEVTLEKLQCNCGKLYHMLKAIEMKSEHLRSLSGFKRKERDQQQY